MFELIILAVGAAGGAVAMWIYMVTNNKVFYPLREDEGNEPLEVAQHVAAFARACGMEGEIVDDEITE